MRCLIYIPILHTTSDLGTLAPSMRKAYGRKFGKKKWQDHIRVIDKMWIGIRRSIRQMNIPYEKVKVYQDGLPVCGMEKRIVADLAKKGSVNHKLVQWLLRRGATLVGTEDPKLLLEEYHHLKRMSQAKTHQEHEKLVHECEGQNAELLQKRDQKISDQIGASLKQGEIGILFIGILHRVDGFLAKDIRISYLIRHLPDYACQSGRLFPP